MRDAGKVKWGNESELLDQLFVGEQAGGYVRVFLQEATEEEIKEFTQALTDVFSPPLGARYVIERYVDLKEFSTRIRHPWFATVLPGLLKKYFAEEYEHVEQRRELVMFHAVPDVLSKNKDLANIFKEHWNRLVSPGELLFTQRGEGRDFIMEAAEKGLVISQKVATKEFFR